MVLWILVLFVVVNLVVVNSVTALGIRPAKTTIISDERKAMEGTVWVVNNELREFAMTVSVEGEMGKYVKVKEKELRFTSENDAKKVEFSVSLPKDVPPGESSAYIVFEETLGRLGENEISSKIVLKHKMIIHGPYPDKYIEVKLNFHEREDSYELVAEVNNLGKKDISSVQSTFFVNDKEQKERELETETVPLKSKETKLLTTKLEKNALKRGEFDVLAITQFDDQKIEAFKTLLVGRPEVEVVYFDPYFVLDTINQYSLDLLNKWNTKVENVFVDVEIKRDNQKVDEFRTKSIDIQGETIKRINDYFDTHGMTRGKYTFDMVVNFWNTYKMERKTFHSELLTEEEAQDETLIKSIVGKATQSDTESKGTGSSGWIWFGVLAGILVGAGGFYIFWRYLHRKEYEGGGNSTF